MDIPKLDDLYQDFRDGILPVEDYEDQVAEIVSRL